MTLHLFNPENDLALAADLDRYTPPAAAVALRRCGALIPVWLASPGDAILVESEQAADAADDLRRRFGLDFTTVEEVPGQTDAFAPWGWSRHTRRCFIDKGATPDSLPDDPWLAGHRRLSSRLTTIDLSRSLGLEPPVAAYTVDEAIAAIATNEERSKASFMKMPWSSSGRGVFSSADMRRELIERRVADIIRSQGCVVIEPDRRRVTDFAVLYRMDGGKARFHALSAFATDNRGAYRGNLILSDEEIVSRLGVDPMPIAERVASALSAIVAPHYSGWAGVDMVTTSKGEIFPCIELNLRTTMGVVAAAMRPYFSSPMLLAPSPANPLSHLPQSL